MKNSKVAVWVKQAISVFSALAKSKSHAIRNKTRAIKARIQLFSLMKTQKLSLQGRLGVGAISHKIHALLGQQQHEHNDDDDDHCDEDSGEATTSEPMCGQDHHFLLEYNNQDEEEDEDDKYPDLRHSLFEEEEGDDELLGDPNGSAIDMVRSSMEEEGAMFSLEDEIDSVADLFIKKFHKRMRLQRLDSLKRFQEMLRRST